MELITTRDAAEQIGVTRFHVARLVREGRLTPAMKLTGDRGAFLFDPATIDEYIAAKGRK